MAISGLGQLGSLTQSGGIGTNSGPQDILAQLAQLLQGNQAGGGCSCSGGQCSCGGGGCKGCAAKAAQGIGRAQAIAG